MKTLHLSAAIAACVLLCARSISAPQDFAPTSVSGRVAIVVISSGTWPFASSGGYRLVLTENNYLTVALTSSIVASSGTYTWTKTGPNTASTYVVDALTGLTATQQIEFTSPTVGTFTTTGGTIGTQSGSFLWEGVPDVNRLVNISTRGNVGTGENLLIAGFVITGSAPKRVLVRGIGPTLGPQGVAAPLADPVLRLFDTLGRVIAENDDWNASDTGDAFSQVGAFSLPTGSKDASLVLTLPVGLYTVHVFGKDSATGVALIEVYELPQ